MTEIWFYELQSQLEKVLPNLIEKSLESGWRVTLQAKSQERLEALDFLGELDDFPVLGRQDWSCRHLRSCTPQNAIHCCSSP